MPSPTELGWQRDVSLSERAYYGVGGRSAFFAEPQTMAEMAHSLRLAREKRLPILVLGAGTNTVFSDEPFPGLALSCARLSAWHWENSETLYAEAGLSCTEVAGLCHAAGRDGAAWMFRLPGLLGAAIRMNARCFGGEISQVCTEILSLDSQGRLHHRTAAEAFLGYKDTCYIRTPELVVAARLTFPMAAAKEEILAKMEKHQAERVAKHHFDFPSCGSTFKNNYDIGVPSGRIFDDLKLRGTSVGGATVSSHHANFIFNTGNATAHDILSLAALMRQQAQDAGRGTLELEVEAMGSFPSTLLDSCGLRHQSWSGKQWAGLFSLPEESVTPDWPRSIFSSFFLEYWRTPKRGCTPVSVEIVQQISLSEARANPNRPFLTWKTRTPKGEQSPFSIMPTEDAGSFVPELWHSSVSEIFLARPDTAEYDEFEITPDLHWLALALQGPRMRKPGHDAPRPELWSGVERFRAEEESEFTFGMHFSYSCLAHLLDGQEHPTLALQCCLSLGHGHYLLAPHWKEPTPDSTWDSGHPPRTKPDFHQPQRFWNVPLE